MTIEATVNEKIQRLTRSLPSGVIPITERLHQKGSPFLGFRYIEGWGNLFYVRTSEEQNNITRLKLGQR